MKGLVDFAVLEEWVGLSELIWQNRVTEQYWQSWQNSQPSIRMGLAEWVELGEIEAIIAEAGSFARIFVLI